MPKILITTSSFDVAGSRELVLLKEKGFEIVLNPFKRKLTEAEVATLLNDDVVGMIAGVEPLTRNVLTGCKQLKVVSRCGIGMDSVDQEAARQLGMVVMNTPGAPVVAVAELTIAHILNLLRRVGQADRSIRNGEWKQIMGNLLAAQTVGIIGYGRIGKRVSQIAHAFGAKVIVYDKCEVSLEADLAFMPMDELLQRADVVSLHVPYEPSTHHLIDDRRLRLMKSGAFLVNVSRGGLVDEEALANALRENRLAGAGIDAFEEEPYRGPLASLNEVLLTAHMGSYAKEARAHMEREAAANLFLGLKQKHVIE